MKNETKEFLAEGLKNFKKASFVVKEFVGNTQRELQGVLSKRKGWGTAFKPKEAIKVKSWRYWYGQAFINAEKVGTINGEDAYLDIGINWYQSELDYPFYEVWLEEGPDLVYENLKKYKKRGRFELTKDNIGLKFYPNPEDFDLERDFNLLIDEFVKIL
jgi:hypothetical protein